MAAQNGNSEAQYREELQSSLLRLGIPPNPPNTEIFTIAVIPGKGQGWIALKEIQPGTPLLDEEVLFEVEEGRAATSRHERNSVGFSALHCPAPVSPQRRFDANSFEMGTGRNERSNRGIFLKASRINDSCIPNAHFTWNPDLGPSGRLTVYAIVSIPEGDEILIDYASWGSFKTRNQRHQGRRQYDFVCSCPACQLDTQFGRESEERRKRMKFLHNRITRNKDQDPSDQTIQSLSDLIEISNLLQQEGLFYPHLADAYHGQALWWYRARQRAADNTGMTSFEDQCREKELQAARMKLDLDVVCNGHDSPEVRKTLDFIFEQ